jgi:gas vesicle protein
MGQDHLHTKEFIVGAAVGSLLGGVAALLTAPSSGKELREDICDTYDDISDKTGELANRGRSIAKEMSSQSCDWTRKAQSAVNGAAKSVKGWVCKEEEVQEEHTARDLLIGGLVGVAVGAAVALLLTPKSGQSLRQDITDIYEDVSDKAHEFSEDVSRKGKAFAKSTNSTANKWFSMAQHLVNDLSEDVHEKGEDLMDHVKEIVNHPKVNEILDWAHLGYRAWNRIQSKKKK